MYTIFYYFNFIFYCFCFEKKSFKL